MDQLIVVGLGNPGSEYEETRHNLGFRVVEELCRRCRKNFRPGKGDYLLASTQGGGKDLILVKPLTYMNNSGLAVRDVLDLFGASPSDMIVAVDDVALPLGTLRVRGQGSDGGHNGLYSIIYHLATDAFPRVRCGIRPEVVPSKNMMADFVLSPFLPEERDTVSEMVMRAADAVLMHAHSGLARTMNMFNT